MNPDRQMNAGEPAPQVVDGHERRRIIQEVVAVENTLSNLGARLFGSMLEQKSPVLIMAILALMNYAPLLKRYPKVAIDCSVYLLTMAPFSMFIQLCRRHGHHDDNAFFNLLMLSGLPMVTLQTAAKNWLRKNKLAQIARH